jgi:Iron-containing redox enzyme
MLLDSGFTAPASVACAALAFHRRLAEWNRARASTVFDAPDWLTSLQAQYRMRRLEHDFASAASASVRAFAREAPSDPERFSTWFAHLDQLSSSTTDRLFARLANEASPEQLRWYLEQHAVAEAGFSELSVLAQHKLAPRDRPGNGATTHALDAFGATTHGDPLACLGQALTFVEVRESTVWEALAVSNLLVALAANRRYAYHAAGALAAIELTAPIQRAAIERGLCRVGLPSSLLPVELGANHSWSWCNDVLPALVAQDPSAASQIAEGALSRLAAAARCFERCHRELDQLQESLETLRPPRLVPVGPVSEGEASYAN